MAGRSSWMTAGLASRGRRLAAAAAAIIIGVAFLTTSLAALTTMKHGLEDALGAGLRDADLVVTGGGEASVPLATYDEIAALDEVATIRGEAAVTGERAPDEWVGGASMPPSGVTLLEGRMPAATGEVLLNPLLAEVVKVGEELTITALDLSGEPGEPVRLEAVGVADPGSASPVLAYAPAFFADDATLREVDPDLTYMSVLVDLAPGVDEETARDALLATWDQAVVQTGPEAAAARVAALTDDTDVLTGILLGFGSVALVTAAIVIANTFTITLAQRTGELALLRAVGATRDQVRRQVVLEAVLLGLLASAVGVGVGLLAAQGLLLLAERLALDLPLGSGVAVTWVGVLAPLLVGVVVTVLASLWPALRATRVSPLAALRPAGDPADGSRRVGWVRLALAAGLIGIGLAAMVYAAASRQVLSGIAGGLVSFVGVLVAAAVVVPATVRLLGLGARAAGVPGRLAVDNAVRNPGRAAATSAALLVGVTLITMTSVGAASAERTALGEIDSAYSVDLLVEAGGLSGETGVADGDDPVGGTVPLPVAPEVVAALAAVDGVAAARAVDTAYLQLGESWTTTPALGLDPARDGDLVRSPALPDLVPGTVGMGNSLLAIEGLESGDTIRVTGPGGSMEARVVEIGLGYSLAVNHEDLSRLGGDDVAPGSVLARLTDDSDVAAAVSDVDDITRQEQLTMSGSVTDRAVITGVLRVLVLVTTSLLGVAVVIAVVGIANTLSLSVLERHREHALLRGLGLTRGQMRLMLVLEGLLLALVSTLIGLTLGVGYAALGVQTVLPSGSGLQLAVPWGQVALIIGVALLAGLLASVLPARRAAQVTPTQGLAAA